MEPQPTAETVAVTKVKVTPEKNLIDSLTATTALDLSRMANLPEAAFVSLMTIQKPLTIATAALAPSLSKMVRDQGEALTAKLICAVLKLYNDSLNASEAMAPRQLFECADLFTETFPLETLKDLILCLKRAKMGQYGTDYNRIDATVITRFFRAYLGEKADWLEQQRMAQKGQYRETLTSDIAALGEVLNEDQRKQLKLLTIKPTSRAVLQYAFNQGEYDRWLSENAHSLDMDILEQIEQQARKRDLQSTLAIVTTAINLRLIEQRLS